MMDADCAAYPTPDLDSVFAELRQQRRFLRRKRMSLCSAWVQRSGDD